MNQRKQKQIPTLDFRYFLSTGVIFEGLANPKYCNTGNTLGKLTNTPPQRDQHLQTRDYERTVGTSQAEAGQFSPDST